MDKHRVLEAVLKRLDEELSAVTRSAKAAHEAATHEESRAEDAHDTRGLEASYLAGAQAGRALELKQLITFFRVMAVRDLSPGAPIEPGALVELDLDGRRSLYFLVSQGGGLSVQLDGKTVSLITPRSPLGDELIGRRAGDFVEIEAQGALREYEVKTVK